MNRKIRNTLVAFGIVALPLLGLTGCNRWNCPGTVASCVTR